jgi:hypothetical protein
MTVFAALAPRLGKGAWLAIGTAWAAVVLIALWTMR